MELRHLRYFVAVAEELHFGRAAARLHMAQPPLSQQIRQLEAELGVALFERTTRNVALTAAGERYLERTRAVLSAVDLAGKEAVRVASGEVGHAVVGFVGSATYAHLPALARRLRAELPDIDLGFKGEMLTADQVAGLHERSIDVALMRTPVFDPQVAVRPLGREPLVVVLPDRHRLADRASVSVADLAGERFISYPSGHRSVLHDVMVQTCQRAGFTPEVVVQVAETSTLVVFVAAGLGVALVPGSVRELGIPGATFRPLSGAQPDLELAVATRVGEQAPAVLEVSRVMAEYFAQLDEGQGRTAAEPPPA